MKNYTIEDFKMNTYAFKPIEASGMYSSYSEKFEINYSSILTALIQDAGRFCERFASDLFIDWSYVESFINSADCDGNKSFLFGFRKDGVDHDTYIFNRFSDYGYQAENYYRSLWRLDIEICGTDIYMKSGRVF